MKWKSENPEAVKLSQEKAKAQRKQLRTQNPKKTPKRQQQIIDVVTFITDNPNHQACIIWEGAGRNSYGRLSWGTKVVSAPRIALKLFMEQNNQEFDESLDVLHSCDNPPCYSPNHLRLGTAKENIAEAIQRGRFTHHLAPKPNLRKLTEDQIRDIRRRVATGQTQSFIAAQMNVCKFTISSIVRNLTYKNVV
jgi:hypothetical protein